MSLSDPHSHKSRPFLMGFLISIAIQYIGPGPSSIAIYIVLALPDKKPAITAVEYSGCPKPLPFENWTIFVWFLNGPFMVPNSDHDPTLKPLFFKRTYH